MTSTSLVISAIYATFNIVHKPLTPGTFPYVLALLMAAAVLTCIASVSMHVVPNRKASKGAKLRKFRSLRGPAPRRV